MRDRTEALRDGVYTTAVLGVTYGINLLMQTYFPTVTLVPMIFVLGVFLVSLKTQGYFWGITASLCTVFMVNYAFTRPYFEFDFLLPESLFSAAVMLIVAGLTSMLTTRIKESEKIRVESEREKMRANLLRAISHDLRTPLTSIYGAASTAIESYDELTKQEHIDLLRDIDRDARWLIRMVENLLSVTRIGSEQVQVVKTPTVLEELIDSSLLKFRRQYPEQAVAVSIPEEFVSIPMDAMLIQQVLLNLLENAVLHAAGMTELGLTVYLDGPDAVFEVADNGCGLPSDRLNGIFSGALGTSGPTADAGRGGMGIGLSVCAAIVRAHGGVITAENRPGGGALFRFRLKREEITDGE